MSKTWRNSMQNFQMVSISWSTKHLELPRSYMYICATDGVKGHIFSGLNNTEPNLSKKYTCGKCKFIAYIDNSEFGKLYCVTDFPSCDEVIMDKVLK